MDKVITVAEREGDHSFARQLIALCPQPAKDPLEEVRAMLRTKYMPRNWWGWDALGIGRKQRERLIKQQDEKFIQNQRIFKKHTRN